VFGAVAFAFQVGFCVLFGRHRGAGECLGRQLTESEIVADQRLGIGVIDTVMFRMIAASSCLKRAAAAVAGNAAIVLILPVSSTDAQPPAIAVDVAAPGSHGHPGIGEPLITAGVDAA